MDVGIMRDLFETIMRDLLMNANRGMALTNFSQRTYKKKARILKSMQTKKMAMMGFGRRLRP